MNPSKFMLAFGGAVIALGLYGVGYVWHVHGQAWSYYGPCAFLVSGLGILHAKHHRS